MTSTLRCTAVFLGIVSFVSGQTHGSPALSTKTERAVVFKDGHALISKSAAGQIDADGRAYLTDVPRSVSLGSFWVVPKTGTLRNVSARRWLELRQGRQEQENSLLLQFDPGIADRAVSLDVSYFGAGLRWIPTYHIAMEGDSARLLMQAEVLNEMEDLHEVDLRLVVGSPNFQFKSIPSPITFEGSLGNPLAVVAPTLMGQTGSQSQLFAQQRFREQEGHRTEATSGEWVPPDFGGESAQELYFYSVPNFSLAVGERSISPLTSVSVPLKHVYTWDLAITRSGAEQNVAAATLGSTIEADSDKVWHAVELQNKSATPWTTGPAFFTDGFLPIAQVLLTYTPAGGKSRVKLTTAPDVQEKFSEREVSREMEATKIDSRSYCRITKAATLQVVNSKTTAINLSLRCDVAGNVKTASDDGRIVLTDHRSSDWKDFRGSSALNAHSTLNWELSIDAGATREVTFEYDYYVWF